MSAVGKGTLFSTINKDFMKCNFVIEEACTVTGMVQHHIEITSLCVTFLTKKVTPQQDEECIWILEKIMNTILAYPNKEFKFVYDRTIITKNGWVDQGDISQGNNNLFQFRSQI